MSGRMIDTQQHNSSQPISMAASQIKFWVDILPPFLFSCRWIYVFFHFNIGIQILLLGSISGVISNNLSPTKQGFIIICNLNIIILFIIYTTIWLIAFILQEIMVMMIETIYDMYNMIIGYYLNITPIRPLNHHDNLIQNQPVDKMNMFHVLLFEISLLECASSIFVAREGFFQKKMVFFLKKNSCWFEKDNEIISHQHCFIQITHMMDHEETWVLVDKEEEGNNKIPDVIGIVAVEGNKSLRGCLVCCCIIITKCYGAQRRVQGGCYPS
ncbi:hypothetical protein ACJX0J_038864, partial [Zea mays]